MNVVFVDTFQQTVFAIDAYCGECPLSFFNGLDFTDKTSFTGGPVIAPDNLGVLQQGVLDSPTIAGARYLGAGVYTDTKADGSAIVPSRSQRTRTATDGTFTTFTPGTTFKRYISDNPNLLPGFACEPARTNYALNSATPATHTTGSLSTGTYQLWCDGTGSVVATAGTAVGTFGTAAPGTPATITITTAGTVVLTCSGSLTWIQLELGAFPTSRIVSTSGPGTRSATVAKFPTLGKIRSNNMAFRCVVDAGSSGQTNVVLFGTYVDSSNYTRIHLYNNTATFRRCISGTYTDATVAVSSNGLPIDIICTVNPLTGAQVSIRYWNGVSWSNWVNGTVNSDVSDCIVATNYELGSINSLSQFSGQIKLFDTLFIPDSALSNPLAWAKQQWGLPA